MSPLADHDAEPASIDDLRVIIREIKQHHQMGDARVVDEALTALLRVLRASGARLLKEHRIQDRTVGLDHEEESAAGARHGGQADELDEGRRHLGGGRAGEHESERQDGGKFLHGTRAVGRPGLGERLSW